MVAAGSLVVQGLTLPWVVRVVEPSMEGPADEEERGELVRLLIVAAKSAVAERDEGVGDAGRDGADSGGAAEGSAVVIEHDAVGPDPVEPSAVSALEPGGPRRGGAAVDIIPQSTSDLAIRIVGKDDGGEPVSAVGAAETWKSSESRRELAATRRMILDMIRAQREALLDAGELGLYSAGSIEYALMRLDYEEVMLTSQPQ